MQIGISRGVQNPNPNVIREKLLENKSFLPSRKRILLLLGWFVQLIQLLSIVMLDSHVEDTHSSAYTQLRWCDRRLFLEFLSRGYLFQAMRACRSRVRVQCGRCGLLQKMHLERSDCTAIIRDSDFRSAVTLIPRLAWTLELSGGWRRGRARNQVML